MGDLQGTELIEMSKKHLGRGIAHHVVCRWAGLGVACNLLGRGFKATIYAMMDAVPSVLDSPPRLSELRRELKLVSNWYDIGIQLDLDVDKLNAILHSPVSDNVKTIHMYNLWLDSDPHATRRRLIEVLKNLEFHTQAQNYQHYLNGKTKTLVFEPHPK